MKTIIKNAKVICSDRRMISDEAVLIEDGRIAKIAYEEDLPKAERCIDAGGLYLSPGLLDTHTHGIGGHDFNTCSANDMEDIIQLEHQEGVTGFLASLVVEDHETIMNRLQLLNPLVAGSFLGIHLEGPYLNPQQKAVMKEEHLRAPDQREFLDYCNKASHLCSMTIAPELEGALALIAEGTKRGIVMNIGHSMANAQQVLQAQNAGAKGITHMYNAMSQHAHRNPGVVTGAFVSDVMCELIADGFHVHRDVVHATYRTLRDDRLVLISDANPFKAVKPGEYPFSGKTVMVEADIATVKETGRIAGSVLAMNRAVKNMCSFCGCGIESAIRMATYNPARLYGWKKGSIEAGYDADLILLDDDFQVHALWMKEEFMS